MALQEAFAATMFGIAPRFQRAILLYGQAGTGKSQALAVLRALLPPKALCTIPPDRWGARLQHSGMVGRTHNKFGRLSCRQRECDLVDTGRRSVIKKKSNTYTNT